jgi:hypothetical protein
MFWHQMGYNVIAIVWALATFVPRAQPMAPPAASAFVIDLWRAGD